jgi:hypothetical protein
VGGSQEALAVALEGLATLYRRLGDRDDPPSGAEAGVEFVQIHGFDQKVVGPDAHPLDDALSFVERGYQDEMGVAATRRLSHAPTEVDAIHARQVPSAEDHVSRSVLVKLPGLVSVGSDPAWVAQGANRCRQRASGSLVAIGHEHAQRSLLSECLVDGSRRSAREGRSSCVTHLDAGLCLHRLRVVSVAPRSFRCRHIAPKRVRYWPRLLSTWMFPSFYPVAEKGPRSEAFLIVSYAGGLALSSRSNDVSSRCSGLRDCLVEVRSLALLGLADCLVEVRSLALLGLADYRLRTVRLALPMVALAFAVAAGCGGGTHRVLPAIPVPRPPARGEPPTLAISNVPSWTYWEPVDVPVMSAAPVPTDLPVSLAQLTRSAGLDERWAAAAPELRYALMTRGFVLARAAHPSTRLGDFYASLRDERIPFVVTLDSLFFLAHLALDRALADVDAYVLAPLVATMLHHLDVRLAAESRVASADLAAAYVVARGLVGVALALAEPTYGPEAGSVHLVAAEKALVVAHSGVSVSPWLGVPIDYSAMSPAGMADHDEGRAGWFRAVSWLQNVSLVLEGAGERGARGRVDVATARAHARAALLLARLLDEDVDAQTASAWKRIERASELVIGGADDVTPADLSATVARAELDPSSTAWIADVVKVDRVRHAAARGRLAPVFHLLGPRSTPDGELLQSLTFPMVGPKTSSEAAPPSAPPDHAEPTSTARNGVRALPTALDVAAWLGSGEARVALHDSGGDAYERYDETLERLMRARPPDLSLASPGRHGTPYLSMIDAIETWLAPSEGDGAKPGTVTPEWRKRKAEVALAAWTELRHDATAFTRIPLTDVRLPQRVPGQVTVLAFVEPHPEAIAKLAGLVRQTMRALVAEGALRNGAPALKVLDEVDDLLWTALGAAVYEAADDPLPPPLEAALAAFPARLCAVEAALADAGAADVPLAVAVHVDVASALALEEATGRIEESWMIMRQPGTHRLWLALGASIPHHELVQPSPHRQSDTAWRIRLQTDGDPLPGLLARDYVKVQEAAPPAGGGQADTLHSR